MEDNSPYFYVENESSIETMDELINLNKKVTYGSFNSAIQPENDFAINSRLAEHHETSGIFRGQNQDWPLLPAAFRSINYPLDPSLSNFKLAYEFYSANYNLYKFCDFASQQNLNFPKNQIGQMTIAQHYGLKTPLLDWTTNIFVAAYFALDLKTGEENEVINPAPYIYHIKDERFLQIGIEKEEDRLKIEQIDYSALVTNFPFDRRFERQFSVFTYHPHPEKKPKKIPINKYRLSGDLFMELWQLLGAIGFSSAHLFPDYAGLADRVKKGYMI
jgi:hypothetical protein